MMIPLVEFHMQQKLVHVALRIYRIFVVVPFVEAKNRKPKCLPTGEGYTMECYIAMKLRELNLHTRWETITKIKLNRRGRI